MNPTAPPVYRLHPKAQQWIARLARELVAEQTGLVGMPFAEKLLWHASAQVVFNYLNGKAWARM